MKFQIKHRFTEKVLYEGEGTVREVLIVAVKDGANLDGANLVRANLDEANLDGASLIGASLDGASLDGASLIGANLDGANLDGANLVRANLVRANLVRANLDGANLVRANLVRAKGYSESHDVFFELVRKEKIEVFKSTEWSIIGQIAIHRLCWDAIKKRFGKKIVRVFKVLADKGFDEYLKRYEEILKEN